MPADDLFQVFRSHQPGELVFSKTFPKNANRDDIIFIEIFGSPSYTAEQKQKRMSAVADQLVELGIRRGYLVLVVTPANAWHGPSESTR